MKIGIITFHRANNYGAVIQAYALMKACSKKADTKIIDYYDTYVNSEYNVIRPIRKEAIAKSIIKTLSDCLSIKKRILRKKAFNSFREQYLRLTPKIISENELKKQSTNFDYIITGSDQVWSPAITNGVSDIYFLKFVDKKVKKVSYAPSVGNVEQLRPYIEEVKKLLKDYAAISVRESDAKQEISRAMNKNIKQVVDPTLLLNREDWESLISSNTSSNDYIFAYSVSYSPECTKITNYLSKKEKIDVVHAEQFKHLYKNVSRTIYTGGPLVFLESIKNAKYVVTSSFHATVFSIIFHKKLIVIPHRKTGIRVIDLLKRCGLDDRCYCSLNEFIERGNYAQVPNWKDADLKLDSLRKDSINWLNRTIFVDKTREKTDKRF